MAKLFITLQSGVFLSGLSSEDKKGSIVGYIHCCAGLRKSRSFSIVPELDYMYAQIDYLESCPVCGHSVLQITRIDSKNNVSMCRKINEKARKLFDKLKKSILFEKNIEDSRVKFYSKFYLNYNEHGVKKKCYSNLSSLKIGLFENKNLILTNYPSRGG